MLLAQDGQVVIQDMLNGGYGVTVPSEKADALSDRLDSEDLFYEIDYDFVNVDDTTEGESTATLFTFGPDTDLPRLQAILDGME